MKTKVARAVAVAVAKELCDFLKPHTEELIVAGSLRRRKEMVGDVELVFVPRISLVDNLEDWFGPKLKRNEAAVMLEVLLGKGVIRKRENVNGAVSWGEKNRYAVHCASGIPVDFFGTSRAAWFNYLVCRTGSAESNTRIAGAALAKGWQWHPYAKGFTDGEGNPVTVRSEREVFELVGLKYLEPWER